VRRRRASLGVAVALVLVGCGSDAPDVPVATAAVTAPSTATTVESTSAPTSTPTTTAAADSTVPPETGPPETAPPETGPPETDAPAPETTVSVPPATPNELGLRAVVDQFREDEILHLLQVRVTNTSQSKVRLTSVQLDWPGMTVVPPTPRSDLLSPGQVLDVPISYGVAVCSETPPGVDEVPPSTPAVAVATAKPGDADPEVTTEIPIADQLHIFGRIYPTSCRDQRVEDAATIRFGSTWTDVTDNGVPGLAGTLVVERNHGNGPVEITDIRGSVLLSVQAERESSAALVTLAPGTSTRELPIVIVESGNCFPHALAESKKTFFIPVDVSIDGEPSLTYELMIAVADRAHFGTMINESCGVG
jgi:hypothetical protein